MIPKPRKKIIIKYDLHINNTKFSKKKTLKSCNTIHNRNSTLSRLIQIVDTISRSYQIKVSF